MSGCQLDPWHRPFDATRPLTKASLLITVSFPRGGYKIQATVAGVACGRTSQFHLQIKAYEALTCTVWGNDRWGLFG